MSLFPANDSASPAGGHVERRLESIVSWLDEIDSRLRAAELATGDEKTAKELRKAVEAVAKHDPKLEERLASKVDVLTDRVASLATTVSTTAAALARKDGEIVGLQRELDAGKVRIEEVAGQARRSDQSGPEIAELRKALAGVSEQKLPRKIEGRLDDLKASVGLLAQRVETLSTTVSTTASGLAGREGDLAALRRHVEEETARVAGEVATLRRSVDPAPVAELRQAVDDLGTETAGVKRDNERGLDAVKAEVGALAARIDAASSAAVATTQGLAASEAHVGTLQAAFDEESDRVDGLLVKLHEATGELASRVAELDGTATADAVDGLAGRLSELASRVDDLGGSVDKTAAGYADREHEIAALNRRFEEISTHVDAGVRGLHATIEELAERGTDPELESRIADLGSELAALATRLETVDASISSGWSAASQASAALDHRLTTLAQQVEAAYDPELEDRLTTLAKRLDEADTTDVRAHLETLHDEVAQLTSRLEEASSGSTAKWSEVSTLVAALGEGASDHDRELHELSERFETASERVSELHAALETMRAPVAADVLENDLSELADRLGALEGSRATVAIEIARASASWADERASVRDELAALEAALRERLDELAETRDARAAVPDELAEERLHDLTERLDRAEEERTALASEIAGARAFWSSGLGAMQARLDSLSAPDGENGRKVDDEVVHALYDIARRLDAVEQSRATGDAEVFRTAESWAAERDSIAAGLDELTRRLDAIGAEGNELVGTSAAADASAEGRYRLELRALELRMEHAEAAARENRDAVLVQLERLASRIEWRLQRLETGTSEGPAPEAVDGPLAQVVSIHGADA